LPEPKVMVIVLTWNGIHDTLECLTSLSKVDYRNKEIVVVDNGSTDGTVQAIRSRFPTIALIENDRNLGYAAGNNVGLRHALRTGADQVLLLNNDTVAAPDFLGLLVQALDGRHSVGIAGPMVYYHTHPEVIASAGGEIDWRNGATRMRAIDQTDRGQFKEAEFVDFVTGCALLAKAETVKKIGHLDQAFFMYFEETEWCVRARRAGYHTLFVPQAKVWHKVSPAKQSTSPRISYYMTRNRLLFLRRSKAQKIAHLRAVSSDLRTVLAWSIRPKYREKTAQRNAMIRALLDYALGKFGERRFA